jgi:hypothetical protein
MSLDHCSSKVANDVLEILNSYKDDNIPKFTNIMLPVIRLPCKLVTNFIEQKYLNVFLIFSHTNIIFIHILIYFRCKAIKSNSCLRFHVNDISQYHASVDGTKLFS